MHLWEPSANCRKFDAFCMWPRHNHNPESILICGGAGTVLTAQQAAAARAAVVVAMSTESTSAFSLPFFLLGFTAGCPGRCQVHCDLGIEYGGSRLVLGSRNPCDQLRLDSEHLCA